MKKLIYSFIFIVLVSAGCNLGPQSNNQTNSQSGNSTAPTNQSDPISFAANDQLFSASKKAFKVTEKFTAPELASQSAECGTNISESYFTNLLNKFSQSEGVQYDLTFKGKTQDSGVYTLFSIPNAPAYKDFASFKNDFDFCAVGGIYPLKMNANYLVFENAWASGVDNASGLPFGATEVHDFVSPTIQLH